MSERPDYVEPVPDDAEYPAHEDDEDLPEGTDEVVDPLEDEDPLDDEDTDDLSEDDEVDDDDVDEEDDDSDEPRENI
ncbi:hypothetical protein AAGQ96_04775 [Pantoea sp. MBD-2R]|uniref:hypothetical protein n=1 Tax=unclassified Pantoea TaxID=2630326 RepID=UPI00143CE8E2|nr:hypothetical protein [Pantoea sp. CCBC3-3-1]